MAQMQNMLDFPPAPKLDLFGHLDPAKATDAEKRGEKLFFGKAACAGCHRRRHPRSRRIRVAPV